MADCYNASYESMHAALKTLCSSRFEKNRRIAVLGQMLELGEHSELLHRKVGEAIAQFMPDLLFTLGAEASFIGKQALELGYDARKWLGFDNKEALTLQLEKIINKNDILLFKASRRIKLEEVIASLNLSQ